MQKSKPRDLDKVLTPAQVKRLEELIKEADLKSKVLGEASRRAPIGLEKPISSFRCY